MLFRTPCLRKVLLAVACAPGGAASMATSAENAGAPVVEHVVVIGITPLPGLDVAKDLLPANVQTATDADIEASHAIELTGFMNRRLGSVYVNDVQNNPFQPDVNFRGYTASPLLGTQQGLSIYLDGVRLNQPFGDVVSWDLIPKSAIASIALMPGSNPLFGLNTLGGALSVHTKDGIDNPGTSVQLLGGADRRAAVELETGGHSNGLNWYVTGNKFREDGWRDESHSDVQQLLGKVGFTAEDTNIAFTAAGARTDLNGNGLQEQRFLERDYDSVYTQPDNTRNRSLLLNLTLIQGLNDDLSFSGNAYYRNIKTVTYNGDINDDSLGQALYQPSDAEQTALAAAGYTGFPTAGETAANAPFPKWRCIANALLLEEPALQCSGVINHTRTDQSDYGLTGQLNLNGQLFGLRHELAAGAAVIVSRSRFTQGSQLGYLNPDRSITGVDAFGDGVHGGTVDDEPYDTRVDLDGRTRTYSAYASSVLSLSPAMHLTLSGRYNRITVRNHDAITLDGPGSLNGDHAFSRLNPAIGLTVSPSSAITLYASANQGSRAPSSVELGCADSANPCKLPNAFAGDPPLRQVVTTTMEAGARGRTPGALIWTFAVFRSDNVDDLLFVADNAAGFGYFKNFGKTRRQGVELGGSVQVKQGFTVGANFTYLDATFRSDEVVDGSSNSSNAAAADGLPGVNGTIGIRAGDRIPLVPRQILKIFADLQVTAAWSIGLDVTATGSSPARGNENGRHHADDLYYLGAGHSGGYAVLNLNTEYRTTAQLKFFAQVNNLFDRKYSTAAQLGPTGFDNAANFEGRPFPVDDNGEHPVRHATFYAPGAPRAWMIGIKYRFARQ